MEAGINNGTGSLLVCGHGLLVDNKFTKAVEQISIAERVKPDGMKTHLIVKVKGVSTNVFSG